MCGHRGCGQGHFMDSAKLPSVEIIWMCLGMKVPVFLAGTVHRTQPGKLCGEHSQNITSCWWPCQGLLGTRCCVRCLAHSTSESLCPVLLGALDIRSLSTVHTPLAFVTCSGQPRLVDVSSMKGGSALFTIKPQMCRYILPNDCLQRTPPGVM